MDKECNNTIIKYDRGDASKGKKPEDDAPS